ncbi:hypothetical protein AAE250_13640 [Bacteroides sp. GD17]|jgi:hypothetical protein|uniref:hypothetical protein n=1 Tax=Bacteroides sp. GD17 TaxID=3139826 RepID=UPI0025E1F455|nr:hypothetical protein [uncultured Bacteroides sp.]
MKYVRFLPWVGEQYQKGISLTDTSYSHAIRIMILGESHYCAHPADAVPELTISIIQDFIDPQSEHEPYKNTYTKFERALAGKPLSETERIHLWNSLLFYNYVQVPISSARQAPTAEEFAVSEGAFFEILEAYRPNCMIAWGQRLYNNLPNRGHQLPDLILANGDSFETWEYQLSGGHTVGVLPVTHPSAAFTPEYWHEVIQAFMRREIL